MQVPLAAPRIQSDTLKQMMLGAVSELHKAGCSLSGGHSGTGADVALGFAITGHVSPEKVMVKGKLEVGQRLVLTKALGTGLLLRGGMLMEVRAEWLEAAWASMAASNAQAARVLVNSGVRACTDVTGFGLLGHALEMADASKASFLSLVSYLGRAISHRCL
jgi:selenide, water dikinase